MHRSELAVGLRAMGTPYLKLAGRSSRSYGSHERTAMVSARPNLHFARLATRLLLRSLHTPLGLVVARTVLREPSAAFAGRNQHYGRVLLCTRSLFQHPRREPDRANAPVVKAIGNDSVSNSSFRHILQRLKHTNGLHPDAVFHHSCDAAALSLGRGLRKSRVEDATLAVGQQFLYLRTA